MKFNVDIVKDFLKKYWFFILIGLVFSVGASYRIEAYSIGRQIWYDEAMLLENFILNDGFARDGFAWIFHPLKCFQMAPFGYLFAVKILTVFFGYGDYVLRFVAFFASLISIPVFYILSKQFLNTKRAVIFANVLFCTNFLLARYATEFKQYGLDVLVFMMALLWLQKYDKGQNEGQSTETLNFRRGALISIVFTILFFISQPTIFLLFGFIACKFFCGLFQNIKNPKHYLICLIGVLPLISVILYKISFSDAFNKYMNDFWVLGFISPNTFSHFIKNNLIFFLMEQNYLKFLLPFTILGAIILLFKKTKICRILLFSMLGMIFASMLECYPLSERLILFLLPFFIIFTALPFDFNFKNKNFNKIFSILMIISLIIFLFLFQMKFICPNRIFAIHNISRAGDGVKILKEYFNPETDFMVVPNIDYFMLKYYSNILDFDVDNNKIIQVNFCDDEKFKTWLLDMQKRPNKAYYWVFIPDNYALNRKLYSVHWLDEQNKKTGFRLNLSKRTILYKIKSIF